MYYAKASMLVYNGGMQPQPQPHPPPMMMISGNAGLPGSMYGGRGAPRHGAPHIPMAPRGPQHFARRFPGQAMRGHSRGMGCPLPTGGIAYRKHMHAMSMGGRIAPQEQTLHFPIPGPFMRASVSQSMNEGHPDVHPNNDTEEDNIRKPFLPDLPKRGANANLITSPYSGSPPDASLSRSSSGSEASSWPLNYETPLGVVLQNLTTYEEEEVTRYMPGVYYTGRECLSKIQGVRGGSNNDGYDDENYHYRVVNGDHLAYRYEIVKELGRGTFGIVVSALDHKTNAQVAVKIIKNKPTYTNQAKEEVNILEMLQEDDPDDQANVVQLLDTFLFRNHFVIVFELLSIDLYNMCFSNQFKPMPMEFIYDFCEQILTALAFIHAHGIVHCDLKPENIVVCQQQSLFSQGTPLRRLKVIDFGSACLENAKVYTYIQSRYYRAPEVVLGIPYSTSIDMWSFGCVLCELSNGYPIFPGTSEGELLERIIEYNGDIPICVLNRGKRVRKFYYEDGTLRPDLGRKNRQRQMAGSQSLASFLRSAACERDGFFLDLVQRCLTYDPDERITPEEALQHPFMNKWRKLRNARRKC